MDERPPVELMLSDFPAPMAAAAECLRTIVQRTTPSAIEVVGAYGILGPRRLSLGYRIPLDRKRQPLFAWILVETVHVHLGFDHGVLLADPDRRLEGRDLRRSRYVTVRSAEEIDPPPLEALLRQAVTVAGWSRQVRLARLLEAGQREDVRGG